MLKYIGIFFLDYVLLFFLASIAGVFAVMNVGHSWAGYLVAAVLGILWYAWKWKRGKLTQKHLRCSLFVLAVYLVLALLILMMTDGNLYSSAGGLFYAAALPFAPLLLFSSLMMETEIAAICIALCLLSVTVFCGAVLKEKKTWAAAGVTALAIAAGFAMVINAPQRRYAGHGFHFMNGYSSTDFTGYHVYDGEKLAVPDRPAPFMIEEVERMPVLDGAEACYPLYAALAKALYKDIDRIEGEYRESSSKFNGQIVTFTNTVNGYYRLCNGDVDIFFGAGPSEDQLQYASSQGVEIVTTPIGREAFVFFTEEDNPVSDLTSDQIRAIYHGDITNWKELGGKNQKIVAFQRPENSGSQVVMKAFMGEVSLKEPVSYEMVSPMEGIISRVAEYSNEDGAIGYTFRYFLTELQQEKHVKILSVDGIYPTPETITDGTYPICANVVAATLASNEKPEVQQVLNYLLSEDGQDLIVKSGYSALP